jgi:hypothetical protein
MKTATSYIRLTVALAVAAAALAPRPAHAQSAEAEAEALFREGKRLMAKGETAKACEKLEASERIDPAFGAELNLADCREKNGQLATAWAVFLKAAATAKHAGNTQGYIEARKRAAALEPRLVYLTIVVPADSRVDGLVIKRNDTAVDAALWNQRIPVDPAEYTISGEAPGHEPWSTSVLVKTKDKKVEVPVLDKRPEARRAEPRRAASDDAGEPGDRAGAATDVRPPEPSRWTGTRKLSVVLAAVGVAAAGGGIGLGLHANSLESQSNALCKTTACTDAHGVDLNKSAKRYALAANIGFATGGVAVVGAAALWLLGGPASRGTVAVFPTLDATRVGISFARSF